jgi:hypothetical protein
MDFESHGTEDWENGFTEFSAMCASILSEPIIRKNSTDCFVGNTVPRPYHNTVVLYFLLLLHHVFILFHLSLLQTDVRSQLL